MDLDNKNVSHYELSAATCLQIDNIYMSFYQIQNTKEKTQLCASCLMSAPLHPEINSRPAQMMNKIEMLCIVL